MGRRPPGRRLRPGAAGWAVPVVALLAGAAWLADPYSLSLLARVLSFGLLAVSVMVLTGFAGLPTLGQVAPYAVGAYSAALLGRAGVVVGPVQLAVAALAAAAFSAVIGLAVTRVRGVVFLMVTLAVGELTAVAAGQWKPVTGGTDGLAGIPAVRPFWSAPPLVDDRAVYGYVLAVSVVVTALVWLVLRSPAGMLLTGCRDHEARMRASGHPVGGYLLAAYTGAGAVAGLGGALLVTSQRYVSPQDVAFEVSALVLLAVTIGGVASLPGALVAIAGVVAVRDWAAVSLPGHGSLLLGALFVLAVYLLPRGLAGLSLAGLGPRIRGPARKVVPP